MAVSLLVYLILRYLNVHREPADYELLGEHKFTQSQYLHYYTNCHHSPNAGADKSVHSEKAYNYEPEDVISIPFEGIY